ncbi:hypothetical protein BHE90_009113 [Fusarium euwallaceae]|uniref:Myb-like domain-containing protein n=2 Tax=Fusarium solani species complex TaxID=232080 RepID=A0A430LL42_9HYPO|nr:hypothetical protein CDV31_008059 [Fusarium ambrosium]RTE76423.1 hypothetical protein BHE90_009113 [Fusarium euwallaceae]
MERRDNILTPWQERALQKGRTPLPEAPGARPWVSHPETLVAAPAAYFGLAPDTGSSSGVRWDVTDIAKLLALSQKGKKWEEIASQIDRSITAVVSTCALWLDRLNQHVLNEEDKKNEATWVEAHRRWSAGLQ